MPQPLQGWGLRRSRRSGQRDSHHFLRPVPARRDHEAGWSFERGGVAVGRRGGVQVAPRDTQANAGAVETKALLRTVYDRYLPNKVVVHSTDDVGMESKLPLLIGKTRRGGLPTAYVCEGYRCQSPVTSPGDLANQLKAGKGPIVLRRG